MSLACPDAPYVEPVFMDAEWSGARLREIRQAKGLSQGKLGAIVGQPQAMISQWESGTRDPDVNDLKALCDALGVWCDAFYREKETPIRWRRARRAEFDSTDDQPADDTGEGSE